MHSLVITNAWFLWRQKSIYRPSPGCFIPTVSHVCWRRVASAQQATRARCQWVLRCPCIMSDKWAYTVCQSVAQCTDDRSDQMRRAWNINCLRAHPAKGTQAHWSARDKQLTVSLTCTSVHAHVQHAAVGCCLIIRLLLLTCFNWYYECISNHTYGSSGM